METFVRHDCFALRRFEIHQEKVDSAVTRDHKHYRWNAKLKTKMQTTTVAKDKLAQQLQEAQGRETTPQAQVLSAERKGS